MAKALPMFQPAGGWFMAKRPAAHVWTTSNRTGRIYGREVCERGWWRAGLLMRNLVWPEELGEQGLPLAGDS